VLAGPAEGGEGGALRGLPVQEGQDGPSEDAQLPARLDGAPPLPWQLLLALQLLDDLHAPRDVSGMLQACCCTQSSCQAETKKGQKRVKERKGNLGPRLTQEGHKPGTQMPYTLIKPQNSAQDGLW
jgi:hypothetical protein